MACLKKQQLYFQKPNKVSGRWREDGFFPKGLFNGQQIQTNLEEQNFVFAYTVTKGTVLKCLVNCTVLCENKSLNSKLEQSQKLLTKTL